MMKLAVKNGFGKVEDGKVVYSVSQVNGLWNLLRADYSEKFVSMVWVVENKKRLSTIQKYAEEYDIEIVEG